MTTKYKVPATYMRGGTSKGVFFKLSDLPLEAQESGEFRDKLLMRVIGSPDPYEKQIDGMGGATSSTSKTVIVAKSEKADHDVDYLFGQVAIDKPSVDWSGNCGNLTAAVGAFAINNGLVDASRIPQNGDVEVRIWQKNIEKTLVVQVPIKDGEVNEVGDFKLDGVAFASSEIKVQFLAPSPVGENMFPTGNLVDTLTVDGLGDIPATMINAGIPTIFVNSDDINYSGVELQEDINGDSDKLDFFEKLRIAGALKMGLISDASEAKTRQHTPKIAFVSPSQDYISSSGDMVKSTNIDLNVRALSMGKLHHAMMGTAAVAIACAAVTKGTLVNLAAGGGDIADVNFGHPSGTMKVGAKTVETDTGWQAEFASMSRSARVIMEGVLHVPL
ncbi:2-methylaconitate cis-trans isomerase PrpF [Pseudoalteromonas spongiae]|uniref:2-methylaconitate cis-trans isomerase PrpF n=1 Tax=Pseudoalteromonas spongiae TaxID=298657 RepID=UPI00110A30A6|nr:2-methylaconitate cis-trans isomerase PrpF [Pseudoalteromonas spongiae]TMO83316.1 2-methylaconitate cis-trans isomerase PrpF [Pseudoalteromonas spongiae]